MKPTFAFVIAAVLGALSAGSLAHARPPTPYTLDLQVRGEAVRYFMRDAGPSGMYGSGVQCMTGTTEVPTGAVLEFIPSAAIHLCTNPTDAGCSATQTDLNYGEPVAAGAVAVITVRDSTTLICQVPVSGSVNTAVFQLR
jgi:hypothetical protein